MATDGLMDFTDGQVDEIYVADIQPPLRADWQADCNRAEDFVNTTFKRSALKASRIIEWVGPDPDPGLSFQDFRKAWRPKIAVYACPACPDGRAVAEAELPHRVFLESGGVIHLAPGLELA